MYFSRKSFVVLASLLLCSSCLSPPKAHAGVPRKALSSVSVGKKRATTRKSRRRNPSAKAPVRRELGEFPKLAIPQRPRRVATSEGTPLQWMGGVTGFFGSVLTVGVTTSFFTPPKSPKEQKEYVMWSQMALVMGGVTMALATGDLLLYRLSGYPTEVGSWILLGLSISPLIVGTIGWGFHSTRKVPKVTKHLNAVVPPTRQVIHVETF